MDLTLDDLERLNVKVTNAPVTVIGMWDNWYILVLGLIIVRRNAVINDDKQFNPFTADPVKALHFAILV